MARVTGQKRIRRQQVLKTSVIREFDGGLNVIDNDLNLSTKYAKELTNMLRLPDGSIGIRYGTKLFSDLSSLFAEGSTIVNIAYFRQHLIIVASSGEIARVNGAGIATKIWDSTFASALFNSPSAWGETPFCSFTQFKGELIIVNGIDKPLLVDSNLDVFYLQDLATLTNANTPTARYVSSHNQYVVMGGDPLEPALLHISNTGASGTWFGDSSTDAVQFDLGRYIPDGDIEMTGLTSYRDRLVVTFRNAIIIMTLGYINDTGDHIPNVNDVILQFGGNSHRSIQSIGDDVLMSDIVGVPQLERALFTGDITPKRASELVDPALQERLSRLSLNSMEDDIYSVYNKLEGQYILFVPSDNVMAIERRGFAYSFLRGQKIKAWSIIRDLNFTCSCRSEEGNVFFAKDKMLFVYGSKQNRLSADYIGEQETYSDDTVHTDHTGFTPVADVASSGLPIRFAWELPWADFDKRMNLKKSRYLSIDSSGTANFTVEMYVDNIYLDKSDTGEEYSDETLYTDDTGHIRDEPLRIPTLSMEFRGGEGLGFGADFGNVFGGGRVTSDERLYAWTAPFKIAKLRVSGESTKPLNIVSIGLAYSDGSIRR